MKEYFLLQYRRNYRNIRDFGIPPLFGVLLMLVLFVGISIHLFRTYDFASYLYTLASIGLTSTLSEKKRNDFLKICFYKDYWKIRILENIIFSSPFVAFLLYKNALLTAMLLIIATIFFVYLRLRGNLNIIIPTPFYKKPFEFPLGFRNTFLIFPISYCLTLVGVSVNNYNLGVFSLLLVFLTVMTYYIKPEDEYYIWSFSLTAEQFLKNKLKIAVIYTFFLALPILIILGVSFVEYLESLMFFSLMGFFFLVTVILLKYSVYPAEMNLPQAVFLILCIGFPPFLLIIMPYLYLQSLKKLRIILE